jgi:hypothetical protein
MHCPDQMLCALPAARDQELQSAVFILEPAGVGIAD